MRTTFIFAVASTLLSLAVATPAGTLSSPNTNALLPLGARSAQQGCWEQCSNHLQCQGLCYRCSVNGRVSYPCPSFLSIFHPSLYRPYSQHVYHSLDMRADVDDLNSATVPPSVMRVSRMPKL